MNFLPESRQRLVLFAVSGLIRRGNPHVVSRCNFETRGFSGYFDALQTGLIFRDGPENQIILIVEDALQPIQIGPEADQVLRSERKIFSPRLVRDLAHTTLTQLRFPSVSACAPDARSVDSVNDYAVTLGRRAGRIRIWTDRRHASGHRHGGRGTARAAPGARRDCS